MDRQAVIELLNRFVVNSDAKEAYAVTLHGKPLQFTTGKAVWETESRAEVVMRDFLETASPLKNSWSNSNGWVRNPDYTTYWELVTDLKASGELKIERLV